MENAQIWWTGGRNGKYLMDFTGGEPVLTREVVGQTRSIETTAVYTTADGELLLYTDGDTIFDGRTHQEIGRGVGGNPSSTEAALIIPVPGGDPTNDFYVFGNTASTSGKINYTRVDIQDASIATVAELDEGRIFGESLGTVPHANGVDFWIVSVTNKSPSLHAYLITGDGVSSDAVVSALPGLPEAATANRGSIVYHPPSARLALTFYSQGSRNSLMYTADFDETTGVASSFARFDMGGYGVAFSPDGTKLYFSDGYRGKFRQIDLASGETNLVDGGVWAMPRLGPDRKIYVVGHNRTTMGVVEDPDAKFSSLHWQSEGIKLPEDTHTAYSLPNQVYAPCVVNEAAIGMGYLSVVSDNEGERAGSLRPEAIEIVLDMSGSMWGQIEGRAKYEIAREIVASTIAALPDDVYVGVRAYSHRSGDCRDSELLRPIGVRDRAALLETISRLEPGQGKTPIGYSLEQVAHDLNDLEKSTAILLISDGLETCGGDPVAAAEALCAAGVGMRVHTVGFDIGTDAEAVRQLEAVAAAGCGQYLDAESAPELQRALRAVGQTSFTLTDPNTGETRTEPMDSEPIRLKSGIYRLTLEANPPVDAGLVEITRSSTTTVRLIATPEGLRRSADS